MILEIMFPPTLPRQNASHYSSVSPSFTIIFRDLALSKRIERCML